ncbi:MAG TPA: hypothetical protein QF753_13190 [Victivallales bacterium]|nr:hypothetical protein [Victivallales bacterium]
MIHKKPGIIPCNIYKNVNNNHQVFAIEKWENIEQTREAFQPRSNEEVTNLVAGMLKYEAEDIERHQMIWID